MILPHDTARCDGVPAGPSGHQIAAHCVNCARRLASRPAGLTPFVDPPKEYPCPIRIPVQEGKE